MTHALLMVQSLMVQSIQVPDGMHNDTWMKNIHAYNAAVKAFMVKIGAVGAAD